MTIADTIHYFSETLHPFKQFLTTLIMSQQKFGL